MLAPPVERGAALGLLARLPRLEVALVADARDGIRVGQAIVAIGHPRGLEYSVVAGVLSGKRDMDGVSMLQLAIPIEQGNSGGPVVNLRGEVVGVANGSIPGGFGLGFAAPAKHDVFALAREFERRGLAQSGARRADDDGGPGQV